MPLLKKEDLDKMDQESEDVVSLDKRAFSLGLKRSPSPYTGAPIVSLDNNVPHITNALPEHPIKVSLGPLQDDFKVKTATGDLIAMQFPSEIQLQILEHLSLSFKEAVEIASHYGISIDWAFRYHDPYKDGYSFFKKWKKMKDSSDKDILKKKMLKNPTYKRLLEWKGRFTPDRENLIIAIGQGNLDMVKYFIATSVNPNGYHLYIAILQGNLNIVKYLIAMGVDPNENNLYIAIRQGNLDIVKYLIEERKVKPSLKHLKTAIRKGNLLSILYLTERVKLT